MSEKSMSEQRGGLLSLIVNAIGMLVVTGLIFSFGYVHGMKRINAEYKKMFSEKFYGIGVEHVLSLYPPGLVISEVYPGTPAEKAGIKKFDVILSVNFEDATSDNLKKYSESAEEVRLKIRRNGRVFGLLIIPELVQRKTILVPVQ